MPKTKSQQHKSFKQATACMFLNSIVDQYSDYAENDNLELNEEEINFINMLYTGGRRPGYVSYKKNYQLIFIN